MKKLFIFLLLFSFICGYTICLYAQQPQKPIVYMIGDNIKNDIQLNTKLLNMTFDINKVFMNKPALVVAVMTTCPFCKKELEYLSTVYTEYYGLFNIIVAVADWANVNNIRTTYGDSFIYIPAVISNLKKVSSVPYNVFALKTGEIVDIHQGMLKPDDFKQKINLIINK